MLVIKKNNIFTSVFFAFIIIYISACGGNSSNTSKNIDIETKHPKFVWAKVAVSNNYAPSGEITNLSPAFIWPAVVGATEYQFGHEDTNTPTRWHDYTLTSMRAACSSAECSYTPSDISFVVGDKKTWWVRANVAGQWKEWSSSHVFEVVNGNPPTGNIAPIAPSGVITTTSPAFLWTPGNGATAYQLGYENDAGNTWNEYQVSADQANCSSSQCSFTPVNSMLTDGAKETWWVRARINNQWGMWSDGLHFRVDIGTPPQDTDSFKIKVDTRLIDQVITSDTQFTIGTTGSGYNYQIDCDSDGNMEASGLTGDYICQYAAPGEYTISIKGDFPQIFYDSPDSGIPTYDTDARKITEIVQWGKQVWRSMANAFAGASNMKITATDKPDLSQVSSTFNMFWLALKLNQDISTWDVSAVVDMSGMFGFAKSFNQDISAWDVSNVENMAYMFDEAESFNQSINAWNVSSVTSMTEMFWGAKAFNQNLSGWDVSHVENMYNMFFNAENFNQDISAWNVTAVKPSTPACTYAFVCYGMQDMLLGTNFSTSNYDKLLISWASQNVQNNIILSVTNTQYTAAAENARVKLINDYGWVIQDAGQQ